MKSKHDLAVNVADPG